MDNLFEKQQQLQQEADTLLEQTRVLELLGRLGTVIRTGSSVTGLMVYPDIDFAVQHETPDVQEAIDLVPQVFSELGATAVKVADFRNDSESASYFIGFEMPFNNRKWEIAATVGKPGPVGTNPPELAGWLEQMTDSQRGVILRLKKEMIDAGRYVGAKSRPPYTFRSVHLYEAVLKGGATTITEVEEYFEHQK